MVGALRDMDSLLATCIPGYLPELAWSLRFTNIVQLTQWVSPYFFIAILIKYKVSFHMYSEETTSECLAHIHKVSKWCIWGTKTDSCL